MAAGIIRNFLIPSPAPTYFPLMFQHLSYTEDQEKILEENSEVREGEEYEEEEEEEDEECEAQEEECLEEAFLNPAPCVLDVTKQLLRFADLINRDIRRYFGRSSGDQDACDIYSDPVSITTSGRLRYYDDLLKIARAGSPEEADGCPATCRGDQGGSSLGPLAELFEFRGPIQGHSQPMIKRHLPLSFWTEPMPHCSVVSPTDAPDDANTSCDTQSPDITHTDQLFLHHDTHCLESTQLDISDLLAYWEPNTEVTHTLMENAHTDGQYTHAALNTTACSH